MYIFPKCCRCRWWKWNQNSALKAALERGEWPKKMEASAEQTATATATAAQETHRKRIRCCLEEAPKHLLCNFCLPCWLPSAIALANWFMALLPASFLFLSLYTPFHSLIHWLAAFSGRCLHSEKGSNRTPLPIPIPPISFQRTENEAERTGPKIVLVRILLLLSYCCDLAIIQIARQKSREGDRTGWKGRKKSPSLQTAQRTPASELGHCWRHGQHNTYSSSFRRSTELLLSLLGRQSLKMASAG